jgi:hypothetical protein
MMTRAWLLGLVAFAALASLELYILDGRASGRLTVHGQHPVPLHEFGAQVPIAQTFTPRADGLYEVRLRVSGRAPVQGTLDWSLFEADGNGGWAKVLSARRPMRVAAGEDWHALRFPAVERSAGRAFRLVLRLTEAREGVALIASLGDAHRGGALTVGGQERWADLVFEARATADTAFGRFMSTVAAGLPGPLRSGWSWVAIIALFDVLVLAFARQALTAMPPAQDVRDRPPASAASRVAAAGFLLVLIAAVASVVSAPRHEPDGTSLLDELYRARFETPNGLHWTFHLTDATVNETVLPSLYAHAPSRVSVPLTVEPSARLRGAVAIEPGAWGFALSDGVTFRIAVTAGDEQTELWSAHVNPAHVAADRKWVPFDVDLSPFGGMPIEVSLITEPSPRDVAPSVAYDWALWGAPMVISAPVR